MSYKDIVIFDLDGTLADIEHRLHFFREDPPNWEAFHAACIDDKIKTDVLGTLLVYLMQGFHVIIATGRSADVASETVAWLSRHGVSKLIPWQAKLNLIMRESGDRQPDHQLKLGWVRDGLIPKERILCIYEDRSSVVKMWRDEGLTCYQVAPGDF
jgi:hypothetical protein